jgi:GntR family transcriptional regulator
VNAYQRIADSLRRRLLAGHWQPGERLPTERQLCRQFAASQITVRRAMQILEEEHLLERRQGSGTYANSTAMRKIPILNADFFGSVRRYAPRLQRRLHDWGWIELDRKQAAVLQACPGDPALSAMRIDHLHDEPVALDEVILVGRYADRLKEEDLGHLDFLRRWQAVQRISLGYCTQTIEAAKARPPVSRLLQVRAGEPLLRETDVVYVTGGQLAGQFISYYRHDRFRFDVTFPCCHGIFGGVEATPTRPPGGVVPRPPRTRP